MGWIIANLVVVGIFGLAYLLVRLDGGSGDHTCPDCGHYFMIEGRPHDNTACEVAKMRKEMAALRAELEARNV